jgi:glycosyltransferase involved in cell wall biosynthesis
MWKRRRVVGGRVGGISDQITDGTGLLVDPTDLPGFGAALRQLLDDPDRAAAMGKAARARVHRHYLPDTQLLRWIDLFGRLLP